MSSTFLDILMLLIGRLPFPAILLVGLIFAIVRRRHAPKAMRLVAVGCGLLLLSGIASQTIFTIIPRFFGAGFNMNFYSITTLIFGMSSAAGIGLILLGAFADRRRDEVRGFDVIFAADVAAPKSD